MASSVVFVDPSVGNYSGLVDQIPAGSEVIVLEAGSDGIAQITDFLRGRTDIGSIHILSHGDDGLLQVGTSTLTSETLSQYGDEISGWSSALTPDADILIYGCDVAANDVGGALIQGIADLTGADVAASTDLTGNAALGGDWELEQQTGAIRAAPLFGSDTAYGDVLSHFRASSLTWEVTTGRTVEFHGQQTWRASYFTDGESSEELEVGDIVTNFDFLTFGDDSGETIYLKVLSVNSEDDFFVAEIVREDGQPITHTYDSDGNFEAYFQSSARISTTQNYADAGYRAEAFVNIGPDNNSPPVSSLAPIVQVADNSVAQIQIPAIDPDGDTLTYSIGTAQDFINGSSSASELVAPPGITVSASGLITWDITDTAQPDVVPGQLWVMTVMVSDGQTRTPLDFLLEVVDTSENQPPEFELVPPDTSIAEDDPQDFVITASDPNANLATIQALNPPEGMTTEYHPDHNELHIHFDPTPEQVGQSFVVTFQATDTGGLTAQTSVTFTVEDENTAPVASIAPASYSTTEQVALSLKNNGLSVSDVDAGNGVVIATLSTAQGQLFVTPGTSGATVAGSGTAAVTITGTLAQINALLNSDATSTVSYINNSDNPAPAAGLTLSVNDQGNSGSGGAKIGSDTVMVNVAAVNDAPVASIAPASYAATEQVALSLKNNGLSVSDADAGNGVVVATLTTAQGQIFVTPGGSGAAVGGSGTHIVTITGTLAQINALLNTDATSTVSYINNSNTPAPAAALTLSINDQGNSGSGGAKIGSDTVMVNVAAVNDAPVASIVPASYSTTEQVALSLKNNGLSVADVDAFNAVVVATLSTAQGQLFVTPGTSGATVSGSGTHIVTITGTLAQINALLNTNATSTVSYINNSNTPAPAAALTLSVNDQGNSGSGGAKIGSDTVMVNVAAVNDAPVASIAPASYSTTEQVALSLKNNGLSVSDVDAFNGVVKATLSTAQGQLFVTPGTSGAAVSGSGTHIVTITGTLAQINALLNTDATSTVSYINNSNTPAPAAALTLSVNDQGNSGSGGAKIGSDTVMVNVAAVNDAPVASIAPASYSTTEQVALSLKNNGLSVSDADAFNGVVKATLSTAQGQLFVTPGTSGAAVSGSGTHIVTITGTLAQINALLNTNATSTVSYINNSNTPAPAAGLTLSVNDQGNSGSGGAKIGSETVMVNVAAVNDAPVAAPDSAGVNEGASVTGNVIAGAAGGAGRDSDVDGTSLSIKGVAFQGTGGGSATPGAALKGQFGTLVVQANGSFTYTGNANSSALVAGETGTDKFLYTLVDAGGATSTATLTVSVVGQNLVITNGSGDLFGQRGDDNITGDGGVNRIRGLEGNDRLDGAGGNDQLWGDQGNDQMFGGSGNDDLDGGDGDDTLRLGADNDRGWGGIGNDSIFGEAGDDTIQGDDGNDFLDAGDGNDTVYGGAGDDTMFLGTGNDIGDGGTGNDVINGGDGVDQITAGAGNDTLRGDAGNDLMWGDDGNDLFFGGDGNDQYAGGAGTDTLNFDVGVDIGWGGADNDVFTFVRGQAAGDSVQDFSGNGASAGDRFVFQGYGTAAQGATFTQVDATHWRIHSADGLVNEVITLANGAGVHASDFSFI